MRRTEVRFVVIEDANSILGSVGRCGSGYNTRWDDWSEQGRENIKKINDEWYERYDRITQHYTNLEKSILEKGFRNPILITCGKPFNRTLDFIPPELRNKVDLLIMEGYDGGSRLWVAQKHNLPVPCIVNDRIGKFYEHPKIETRAQLLKYYQDVPGYISFGGQGLSVTKIHHSHMDNKYVNPEEQAAQIIPLWFDLMTKYGYKPEVRPQHYKYLTKEQLYSYNRVQTENKPGLAKIPSSTKSEVPEDEKLPYALKKTVEVKIPSSEPSSEPIIERKKIKWPKPDKLVKISTNRLLEPNEYSDFGNLHRVLNLNLLDDRPQKILQIGNDHGRLMTNLIKEKGYKYTHFFLIDGCPGREELEREEKEKYYLNFQRTRRVCVDSGIKFFSVIDASKDDWVFKLRGLYFDIIFIRSVHDKNEIRYFVDLLYPFVSNKSKIVIETYLKGPDINLEKYHIGYRTNTTTILNVGNYEKLEIPNYETPVKKKKRRRRRKKKNDNATQQT